LRHITATHIGCIMASYHNNTYRMYDGVISQQHIADWIEYTLPWRQRIVNYCDNNMKSTMTSL